MTEHNHSSTHPPLPPTTEDDRVYRLRLLRSRRVGVSTYWRLISDHGSAQAALEALPEVAASAGVRGYAACPPRVTDAELRAGHARGARLVFAGERDYPAPLLDTGDAPPMLWVMGDAAVLARPKVALVGARNASSLGLRMARMLAEGLGAAGLVTVSGLARGVDAAAHKAALPHGTIAAMAGGVDVLYPAENARLADQILEDGGARLSEQPMGMQPMARHFPMRNRIISGLSMATIVVEAAQKSGSLITARGALDQGRDVLAVPGHPLDARAAGCNMLIRDGARLVRSVDDILEALGPQADPTPAQITLPMDLPVIPPAAPERRTLRDTAALHGAILARLGPSPLAEDQLIRDLGAEPDRIGPALTDLELDGRIDRQPGGLLCIRPTA